MQLASHLGAAVNGQKTERGRLQLCAMPCRAGADAHGFMFGLCPDCAGDVHSQHHGSAECGVAGCACEEGEQLS